MSIFKHYKKLITKNIII